PWSSPAVAGRGAPEPVSPDTAGIDRAGPPRRGGPARSHFAFLSLNVSSAVNRPCLWLRRQHLHHPPDRLHRLPAVIGLAEQRSLPPRGGIRPGRRDAEWRPGGSWRTYPPRPTELTPWT